MSHSGGNETDKILAFCTWEGWLRHRIPHCVEVNSASGQRLWEVECDLFVKILGHLTGSQIVFTLKPQQVLPTSAPPPQC